MTTTKNLPQTLKRLKQLLIALLILLLAYGLGQLMMSAKSPVKRAPERQYSPLVEVMPIELSALTMAVSSRGTVEPKQLIDVISEVSGEVLWLSPAMVNGGRVKIGETLLTIDPVRYQADVADAKALVAKMQLALADEQIQQNRGGADRSAQNQLVSSLRSNKLALVEADLTAAKAQLRIAEHNLSKTTVKAAFNGVISNKSIDVGQFIATGTRLLTLLGTDNAEIRLPVTASEMMYLDTAVSNAEVILTSRFGQKMVNWEADLLRIEQVVNTETRVFNVIANVNAPYDKQPLPLSIGLFVEAVIQGKTITQAVRLPTEIVHGEHVFVVNNGKLERRAVGVYRFEHNAVVINEGLNAGDQVVMTRLELMVEGMPVTVKTLAKPAAINKGSTAVDVTDVGATQPVTESL